VYMNQDLNDEIDYNTNEIVQLHFIIILCLLVNLSIQLNFNIIVLQNFNLRSNKVFLFIILRFKNSKYL